MDVIKLTDGCLGDETMKVRCDLAQAAAPVEVCYSGDTWEPTQYQCADARHTRRGLEQIARLLAAAACEATAEEAEACEITDEPPVFIEFAVANETIRDGGGLDEFAGLEHPYMADACAAYRAAAVAALADDPRARRLVADRPHGQRILHSAWAGTYWKYSVGAIGTMGELTEAEKAAVSAADDAGRAAARKVIEEADSPQVSRHEIAAMQDEAVAAGDDAMAAICAAALDGDPVA